ncbi:MAG: tryptophan--tRNA ligase [Myxococcota bacterium]
MKTSLTGIKPSGIPHLGNYLGAIQPALALAEQYRTMYFIADYHALTTLRDAEAMRSHVLDVTATWLACGLDPKETLIYRQSDIPEVFELSWVFCCLLATGQLERGHAYKDALAKGVQVNAGIFNYPALMAADIVLYDADMVPVGQDQKQHLELARDVALRVNHVFGAGTVVVPEPLISEAPLVPGTDGEKMSKSRNNTIPLFAHPKQLRKVIMSIASGSEGLEEPKDPESSSIVQLFRLVASESDVAVLADKLRRGGYGWGHAKQDLFEVLEAELGPKRKAFEALRADRNHLHRLLQDGAERARTIAEATMSRVRCAVGVR